MSDTIDYVQEISHHDWAGLITLWAAIEAGTAAGWASGKAMEHLVLRAFELSGAQVRWPYRVIIDGEEIEQIDGVVYFEGMACLVECKDTVERINVEPIAKLRSQLLRRPGNTIGSVFSRGGFTNSAITLARFTAPQTILLWSGEEIIFELHEHYMGAALLAKYRYCIEYGLPNYYIIVRE